MATGSLTEALASVSACDTCPKPGACCNGFPLTSYGAYRNGTKLEAMIWAASVLYEDPTQTRMFIGAPFLPIDQRSDGTWRWSCVDLLPNGRCGNYDNRPFGPCVMYEPGADPLCAIHPDHGT